MLSAPSLYAASQIPNYKAEGKWICHWCGSPCNDRDRHDDPYPQPFSKVRSSAKHPAQPYSCKGCWLFRRTHITVQFLGGEYKDRQSPRNHSWWITEQGAWALERKLDGDPFTIGQKFYDYLLRPPLRFALSVMDGTGSENQLHNAVCNDFKEIKADTLLAFTVNNIHHSYTVYELEQALKWRKPDEVSNEEEDEAGKFVHRGPGVQALMRLFGPVFLLSGQAPEKLGKGRPKKEHWVGGKAADVIRKVS